MTTAADYAITLALQRGLLTSERAAALRRDLAADGPDVARLPDLLQSLATRIDLDPAVLGRMVADEFGLPWVELSGVIIPAEILGLVPHSFVVARRVIPIAHERGVLRVAVTDPLAVEIVDDLAYLAGMVVQPALAARSDIDSAIARHYGWEMASGTDLGVSEGAPAQPWLENDEEARTAEGDGPVITLVHDLIAEGIRRRASDIHLEPLARRFRVRYRIDGVLLEVEAPPKRLELRIVSRLKIMANLSIAEKRVPQDGRLRIDVAGRSLDLRVSSLPTAHGESIVMRVLDRETLKPGLPELGFLPDDQSEFARQIAAPDGIMLVTGPTGSGKTTTLYAALHPLNQADRKIITVEEPVEYQITGINQVPVNAAIGMTFAAALRAMLRQAPNVIMVGEIRDGETAEIALNAALTGHLVFSTLHTNDAPAAVTRLIDLGAKPFVVAAALRSVLAQRLVRRICPACKRSYQPAPGELEALALSREQLVTAEFAHGAGCRDCQGTGFRGRLGVFELLPVDDGIRALIYDNVTATRLRAEARRAGMRTMREDGIRKVLAGLTTIEEVLTATVGDPH